MAAAAQDDDLDAVLIRGLRKVYPGKQPKVAVKNLTMGIRRGECFGMLGPNGRLDTCPCSDARQGHT